MNHTLVTESIRKRKQLDAEVDEFIYDVDDIDKISCTIKKLKIKKFLLDAQLIDNTSKRKVPFDSIVMLPGCLTTGVGNLFKFNPHEENDILCVRRNPDLINSIK